MEPHSSFETVTPEPLSRIDKVRLLLGTVAFGGEMALCATHLSETPTSTKVLMGVAAATIIQALPVLEDLQKGRKVR